jgi:protein Mpv17
MFPQGKSPSQVKQEVGDTWYKALSAGWKLWPFVHMLTFSPLIPVEYKLLFVGTVVPPTHQNRL